MLRTGLIISVCWLLVSLSLISRANSILIPMDEGQKNHLKAYGMAYDVLKKDLAVDWLLNYRGGSFLVTYSHALENECVIRGISFEVLTDGKVNFILNDIVRKKKQKT